MQERGSGRRVAGESRPLAACGIPGGGLQERGSEDSCRAQVPARGLREMNSKRRAARAGTTRGELREQGFLEQGCRRGVPKEFCRRGGAAALMLLLGC